MPGSPTRLAAPLGDRLHAGARSRCASDAGRDDVERRRLERRRAAGRALERAAGRARGAAVHRRAAARGAARRRSSTVVAAMRYAPWLGRQPAAERPRSTTDPGAAPSWDNVRLRSAASASATSMRCTRARGRHAGPTVLTAYWRSAATRRASSRAQRRRLLDATPGRPGPMRVVPDLARRPPRPAGEGCARVDLMRYGHERSRSRRSQQPRSPPWPHHRRVPLRPCRPLGLLGVRGAVPRHPRRSRRRLTVSSR